MSQGPAAAADLGVLADLAPELAATFVSIASDIALVIDPDGVVRNVTLGSAPISQRAHEWVGLPFADAVTDDTRAKIHQLLQEVDSSGLSRAREVNLPGAEGLAIPVSFAAIRLGTHGPVLAVGRDLRAIAAIQQRFIEAQQELERDYWRQRQAESRYRLLFQVATDAVLVVDADTLHILEANLAAAQLFGRPAEHLVGQSVSAGMAPGSRPSVDELLVTARLSGRPAEIRAWAGGATPDELPQAVDVAATPFRAALEGHTRLLLLVRARARGREGRVDDNARRLAEFIEHTPDGVAITDSTGRLQMANPALLQMCVVPGSEVQLKGRHLAELLGDPARRIDALLAEVRRHGIATRVRVPLCTGGTGGGALEVEISATLLAEGDQECIGVTLRRPVGGPASPLQPVSLLASAIENLAGQLGRVSLPELMQEATYLAERHLIRIALARAHGDVRGAADWLDITPESLTLRMQRHGLSVHAEVGDGPPPLLN